MDIKQVTKEMLNIAEMIVEIKKGDLKNNIQ